MPRRVYADLPKFKRVHQAMMEAARQNAAVLNEIDEALSGRRTAREKEVLKAQRKDCEALRKQHLDVLQSFVRAITEGA